MDDSKIIELFFARNEDAIKHTDDTYGRRLFHLADNIVHNDQDAEESVSDTYMKAWDTIPPKKPVHLFAYLPLETTMIAFRCSGEANHGRRIIL